MKPLTGQAAAVPRQAAWMFACALVAGCARDENVSGPEPIEIMTSEGVVMAQVGPVGGPPVPAVIDVLSPLTVLGAPEGQAIVRRTDTVYLYGASSDSAPRAALSGVFQFAFCGAPTCASGPAGATQMISAIVGADTLAGSALRLDMPRQLVTLFPDIVGDTLARSAECDAVFVAPFHGGGTMYVRGTPVALGARRPVVDVCANSASLDLNGVGTGVNTSFVVSTAIARSVMGRATYNRLALADPALPAYDALPAAEMYYAGTALAGRAATLAQLTVTSRPTATAGDAGGACEALVRRARVLADAACPEPAQCVSLPAAALLTPAEGLHFLIVDDAEPMLQALRAELRENELPEIDGILGGDALTASELDFDYPNNRILWRCGAPGCRAEPLFAKQQKSDLAACFAPASVP